MGVDGARLLLLLVVLVTLCEVMIYWRLIRIDRKTTNDHPFGESTQSHNAALVFLLLLFNFYYRMIAKCIFRMLDYAI